MIRYLLTLILTLFMSNSEAFPQSSGEPQLSDSPVITPTEVYRYGSTDEILIGVISAIAVDDESKVYIADRNQTKIHVFEEGGAYLTSLGRKGRGPAEFSAINPTTTMVVHKQSLFVTDFASEGKFFPDRVQVFSLTDFKFSQTINLLLTKSKESGLTGYYPTQVYPRDDNNLIVAYKRMPNEYREEESLIKYIIQTSEGEIVNSDFYSHPDKTNLVHYETKLGPIPYHAIHSFPFFPRSLFAISENGHFYAARTEKFSISVFNNTGELINKIEQSIEPIPLSRRELLKKYDNINSPLGEGVASTMIREADNLPDHWPVLQSMRSDDEGRIWVSTRVKGFEVVNWWVLTENGEVVGQFTWPVDRYILEIQNGHIYTLEEDKDTYLQEVVKYKIELTD